jgi:predicted  nucleic acid-binding Zn-ribbon protein
MKKEMEQGPKAHIDDLHFEHEQWKRELNFLKDEYKFFTNRLEEIATRYTKAEVMKELEHFQNQLYIQKNAIDQLLHDINQKEHELASYAEAFPVAVDHVLFDDHKPLREQVNINRDIVTQFKSEYQRFLAKWM